MAFRHEHLRALVVVMAASVSLVVSAAAQPPGDDAEAARERVLKAAVRKVAASVVQIQTSGGTEAVSVSTSKGNTMFRKGVGPTTGLIVGSEGYIISSAFNFANKPSEIFVSVPGHKDRYRAKVVASDQANMLTLLKIEAKNLPVPSAAPKKELKVGQWSVAVGRTWGNVDTPPSMSIGIVSALERIWGKAIQTDAKVSPVNYGGPLVDARGRVQGVLVPASPQGQDETTGLEWYDSGIGFAIPLEDVFAVLPRLKAGQTLQRGFLGIAPQGKDIYGDKPVIGHVAPESAAARAGIKVGDLILEIDGVQVERQAQIMHLLGKKYEGDTVSLKVRRDKQEIPYANLKLTGKMLAVRHAFLGILPMRDDPEVGVEVRYVFAQSPAEAAGIKAGDRIMGIGRGKDEPKPFPGQQALVSALNSLAPGAEISLDVRRKDGKSEKLKATLADMSDSIPDKVPAAASLKKALEPKKKLQPAPKAPPMGKPKKEEAKKDVPKKDKEVEAKKEAPKKVETGMLKRSNAAHDHEYWVYVPENYDPNIAHALVVWLHPAGMGKEKDAEAMVSLWEDFCAENHIILVGPRAGSETGWLVSETGFVLQTVRDVATQYTIDRQRFVIHGMGVGGQLAYYIAFNNRDMVRGVAAIGAPLANEPKENVANQRLSFFLVVGDKDPRVKAVQDSKNQLVQQKFPVVFRELQERGHEYLENSAATLKELVRWIDTLDRL